MRGEVMDILMNLIGGVAVLLISVGVIIGSYAAVIERSEINKGFRDGKNDYYGNKIEGDDK
jgi:hypothetical protein